MTKADNKVYLITGANRGIGLGFVRHYLSGQDNLVIACVRDLFTSSTLPDDLEIGPRSRLLVISMDCTSPSAITRAIQQLDENDVARIDTIIANAAASEAISPLVSVAMDEVQRHIYVNAFAPLLIFRASLNLLEKSTAPQFVYISTFAASIGSMEGFSDMPFGVYGASKALGNYFTRKLSFEHPDICLWSIAPGYVDTKGTEIAAKSIGADKAPKIPKMSVGQTVVYMVKLIDNAVIGNNSGRFFNYTGEQIPW